MSQTHACPVCGRPGLPPNCASCPQCDADLTCFQALDSLASPAEAKVVPPKRRFPWAAAAVLVLTALLILAGLAASMKSRLSELDRQLAELKVAKQRPVTESGPKQVPVHAVAQPAAESVTPPPENKIQIDARVRIIDEREAAAAAPPSKPVSQADMAPKVVREAIRQPDTNEDNVVPSAPSVEKTEKTNDAAAQEQPEEKLSSFPFVASQETQVALAADTPETPPVLLKPGFRKHRVRPAMPAAKEEFAQQPVAAVENNTSSAAAQQQRGGTFSYLVKDGETAWDIAERFYGDRKYYPVVMEQNPHIFLGFIRKNSTVRLFVGRSEAAALYRNKIEQREGLLLWKYEVRPGETWRSIYARFFLPRYSDMIFYGDQYVAPGKTVRIILR